MRSKPQSTVEQHPKTNRSWSQTIFNNTKSYIPACSNISKLIINNDQALLLHVQNLQTDLNSKYICVVDEELQLHQYVPMPHPNNIAAVLHMVYLVTKNLPQIKNYFVSNQELQKYEKLSNMENSE